MPHCIICDQTVDDWLPHPHLNQRSEFMKLMQTVGSDLNRYQCPACGCTDRDRHLWLYLSHIGLTRQLRGARVLHVAPERSLERKLAACGLGEYVRGDLFPSRAGIRKVDIEQLEFPDGHFDLILCNHVLEHVGQPERALAEFRRCLTPKGVLIAQTPYSPELKKTFELKQVPSAEFARLCFGQEDHVRLFGDDIVQYFHDAGLQGDLLPHDRLLPQIDPQEWGCNRREPLFFFSNP
jgi:SAM-dependent methyltransferase